MIRATIGALVCVGVSAAVSLAQSTSSLQPVEPGSADVGPLRISARLLPSDLRAPTSFERVYRIPGAATGVPSMESGDRYARISGGLTAVFQRSQYLQTKSKTYALIPSGTVFYIGGLPESAAPKPSPLPANIASTKASNFVGAAGRLGPVDLRVHDDQAEAPFVRIQTRPDAAIPPDNVLVNDTYRRLRLRAMLTAAAHAGETNE